MEAKELRIGNLTRDKLNKTTYEVTANGLLYLTACENEEKEIAIEPIPLTEEWLLKFGFTHIHDYLYKLEISSNDAVFIFINLSNHGTDMGISINNQRIYFSKKYVHQLQNLFFALKGKELKLKQS